MTSSLGAFLGGGPFFAGSGAAAYRRLPLLLLLLLINLPVTTFEFFAMIKPLFKLLLFLLIVDDAIDDDILEIGL